MFGEPSNEAMWRWWYRRFGRALVLDYQATCRPDEKRAPNDALVFDKLASYLTKYVVKEGSSGGFDWDFYAYSAGKEIDLTKESQYPWNPMVFAHVREGLDGILQ